MHTAILKIGEAKGSAHEVTIYCEVDTSGDSIAAWSTTPLATSPLAADIFTSARADFGADLVAALLATDAGKTWIALRAMPGGVRTFLEVDDALDAHRFETMRDLVSDKYVSDKFLFTDEAAPLSRWVRRAGDAPRARPIAGALRVLVVVGPDAGTPAGEELRALRRRFSRRRHDIDAHFVVEPTIAQLQTTLDAFKPHVFHFIGHGTSGPPEGDLRVGPADNAQPWSKTAIQLALAQHAPCLAILNACQTATSAPSTALVTSVGAAFIGKGTHAVLAMGGDVQGSTAVLLSDALYAKLAEGAPFDVAVAHARRKLLLAGVNDWHLVRATLTGTADQLAADAQKIRSPVVALDKLPLALPDTRDLDFMVDRDQERSALSSAIDDQRASVLVLNGTKGSGKTTIAKWIAERLVCRDHVVRWVDGPKHKLHQLPTVLRAVRDGTGGGPPQAGEARAKHFSLFAHTLNHVLEGKTPPPLPAGVEVLDDGRVWFADPRTTPEQAIDRIMSAFSQSLASWATEKSVVIALDAFHEIDRDPRSVIEKYLITPVSAGQIPGVRVVVTFDDAHATPPWSVGGGSVATRPVALFPASELETLLIQFTELRSADPDLVDLVRGALGTLKKKKFPAEWTTAAFDSVSKLLEPFEGGG